MLDLLADLLAVCTNRTVIVEKLIDHIARNDSFWSMNEINVLSDNEPIRFNNRAHKLVHCAGADSRFHNDSCPLRTNSHHLLDGSYHIAGIDFLRELVIRGWDRDDIHICLLIVSCEPYASLYSCMKQIFKTFFLKGRFTGIECGNQLLVIVGTNYLHTMGGHH